MLDQPACARIRLDPRFQTLARDRAQLSWSLAGIIVVLYFGFVFLVALAPGLMAVPVWGVITLGFALGLAVMIAAVALTGIYVVRANSQFDALQRAIVEMHG